MCKHLAGVAAEGCTCDPINNLQVGHLNDRGDFGSWQSMTGWGT
jgi:hypothetical protein